MSPRGWILAAALFLVASLVLGVLVGPVDIGLGGVLESVVARIPFLHVHSPLSATDEAILWDIRMPRVVLGALVGAMLAVAGASYQGVFRNPLADPYLLGVAAGAGLGATIAIVYDVRGIDVQDRCLRRGLRRRGGRGRWPPMRSGGRPGRLGWRDARPGRRHRRRLLHRRADVRAAAHSDTVQEVYSWILGRLRARAGATCVILLPYVAVAITAILSGIDASSTSSPSGDDEAASLGVNVGRVRLAVVRVRRSARPPRSRSAA